MEDLFRAAEKPEAVSLDAVLAAIRRQAAGLRELKAAAVSQERLNEEVWRLLHLKYLYCRASPAPVADPDLLVRTSPYRVKIRWVVAEPAGERGQRNTVVRYQRTFHDRTFVTAREALETIKEQMRRKYNVDDAGVVLVERISRTLEAGDGASAGPGAAPVKSKWAGRKKKNVRADAPVSKSYEAVGEDDVFKLPLTMPGPVLAEEAVFNLLVAFVPLHAERGVTPAEYAELPRLPLLVDCGCNLFDKQLQDTRAVVDAAIASGVHQLSLLSTNLANCHWNIDLCKFRSGTLFTTVGIHPLDAAKMSPEELPATIERLEALALENATHVRAVGEIGLDVSKAQPNVEVQEAFLRAQLELAAKLNLPVLLHERDARERFVPLLADYAERLPGMLINCFTGDVEALQAYVSLGAYIGVTGIIANTDRGAHLPPLLRNVPRDRLVIGTDAPYMTPFNMPQPFPRCNSPALLPFVLVKLAEALGRSALEVADEVSANTRTLFRLERPLADGSLAATRACIADPVPFRTAPMHYYGPAHLFPRAAPAQGAAKENGKQKANGASTSPTGDAGASGEAAATSAAGDAKAVPAAGSADDAPSSGASEGPSAAKESEAGVDGSSKLFAWKGVYYACSEKELTILQKQKRQLPAEAFDELFRDFDLQRVDMS